MGIDTKQQVAEHNYHILYQEQFLINLVAIYIQSGIPMLVVKAVHEISKNAFAVGMQAGTKTV